MNTVDDFWIWLDMQFEHATEMGILPAAFWIMTPRRLNELWTIYERREARITRRTAWMTHWIMAAWAGSKKTPKVGALANDLTVALDKHLMPDLPDEGDEPSA